MAMIEMIAILMMLIIHQISLLYFGGKHTHLYVFIVILIQFTKHVIADR